MRILNPTISGSLIVSGSTTIEGHIIPNTTETYDLGSPTKKWRDLYLSGSTIYLGDTKLTSGDSGSLEVKDVNDNILPIVAKSLHVGDGTNMIEIRRDNQRGTIKFLSSTMQETGELVSSDSIVVGTYSGSFTGSFIGDGSQLSGVTSYTDSDTLSYINSIGVVSGSVNWDTLIGKPSGIISSSAQLSNATIPGNLTIGGTITAQEFHTEFVSASIIYQSGSTQFGNSTDDIHTFVGTVSATTIQNVISSSAQVDYNSIQNQPTIPTNNNQLTNGAGYITSTISSALTISADSIDTLNFSANSTNDARGISFNNRTALSADYNDGWLRINQGSEFTNGVYTPGNFRADGRVYVDNGTNYLSYPTGNYGSIQINGGGAGSWQGFSIDGRVLLMHNGATATGIYNDVNNQWMFYGLLNGSTYMGYAGTYNVLYTTSGGASLNGTFSATGDVIAYSSDRRLKKDIKEVDNASKILSKIKVYNFNWDKSKTQDVGFSPKKDNEDGFIAQELQEVYPNAVDYAPFDRDEQGNSKSGEDYLTVKQDKLIPLLVQSNKELQDRITKLEQILKNNGFTK